MVKNFLILNFLLSSLLANAAMIENKTNSKFKENETDIEEADNREVMGAIPFDLFQVSVLPYLYKIDDSSPENLISSLKELIKNRRISKVWEKMLSDEDIIKFLKINYINVNVKDSHGNTALHIAAQKGYKKLVEILLEVEADANAIATYEGDVLYDELLFKKRFPFLPNIETIISKIENEFDSGVINLCIIHWLPINDAIYNGNYKIAEILCEATNIYAFDLGCFFIALEQGIEIFKIMPIFKVLPSSPIFNNIEKICASINELRDNIDEKFSEHSNIIDTINSF